MSDSSFINELMPHQFDAFLCHSSKDNRVVNRLHKRLERYKLPANLGRSRRKLKVFHYKGDAPLSDSLKASMQHFLEHSQHLVLAASNDAADTDIVNYEINTFLQHHTAEYMHVVLANHAPPGAYPTALKQVLTDPVYADLRMARTGWLSWWLVHKRKFKRATIPLLAVLFDVEVDQLIQRNKRRKRQRLLAIALPLLIGLGIGLFQYAKTETHAWMPTDADAHTKPVSQVAIHYHNGVTIRTLAEWVGETFPDLPANIYGEVMELNTNGEKTGQLNYVFDSGGEMVYLPNNSNVEVGTLEDELQNMRVYDADLDMEYLNVEAFKADAFAPATHSEIALEEEDRAVADSLIVAMLTANNIQYNSIFKGASVALDEGTILFADIYSDSFYYGAAVPLYRPNGGAWQLGELVENIEASSLAALRNINEKGHLLAVFKGDPENGIDDVILYSTNRVNWERITPGSPQVNTNRWFQLKDAVMAPDNKQVIVAKFDGYNAGNGSVIMLTFDGGAHWELLEHGLPANSTIDLVGVLADGTVVGLMGFEGAATSKRLVIWRKRTFMERITNASGLSRL